MSTKEEQKQHLIDIMKADEELGLYEHGQDVGHSVQVEETLEEAAERNKLDLNKIEVKLDTLLENETTESLNNWLKEKRDKNNNMTQQKLEEAAKELYPIQYTGRMFMPTRDELNNAYKQEAFIEGAKWQQEQDKRMYSEEEVLKLLINFSDDRTFLKEDVATQWFEQFKKQ